MTRGVGGGTFYPPKEQLEAWFVNEAAGSKKMYARGAGLDHNHEVPRLVRDWIATGEVVTAQKRDPATGELWYIAVRCRPAERTAADQTARRVVVDDAWRETADGRIFLGLVRAANMGLPCPTNAELAEMGGLRDADAARYRLRVLADTGRIQLEHSGAGSIARRVKIIETGRWTATIIEGGK